MRQEIGMGNVRRGILAGGAILVMLVLTATGAPAASDGVTPPPASVVESLAPGGDAFDAAIELNATPLDTGRADASRAAQSTTRFGTPHMLLTWVPSSSKASTLGAQDFDAKRGTRWVAVEYISGTAVSAIQVDNAGAFVQLDGWLPDDIAILAALPDDAKVVGTSLWGDELYSMTPDNRRLTALTPAAQALVGSKAVTAKAFRDAKNEQHARGLAQQPTNVSDDAIGAFAPTGGASTEDRRLALSWGSLAAVVGGLVLIGGGGYALGRRRTSEAP